METKRPTISIKKHLTYAQLKPTKSALNGVLKKGNKYSFTDYKHEELIDKLEDIRIGLGLDCTKFSLALGYSRSAYNTWRYGGRFTRPSYTQVFKKAEELKSKAFEKEQPSQLKLPIQDATTMTDEQMAEYLMKKGWRLKTLSIEEMISHLKSLGYKIQKPITTYEEI